MGIYMLLIEIFLASPKVDLKELCFECRRPIGTRACVHIKSALGLRLWLHADCVKVDKDIFRVVDCLA